MSQIQKISFDLTNLPHKHHIRIQQIISQALQHNQKLFPFKANPINKLLNELKYPMTKIHFLTLVTEVTLLKYVLVVTYSLL